MVMVTILLLTRKHVQTLAQRVVRTLAVHLLTKAHQLVIHKIKFCCFEKAPSGAFLFCASDYSISSTRVKLASH